MNKSEIIQISVSQSANHISTHFYNSQESYLHCPKGSSPIDKDVYFYPSSTNQGFTSYKPRTIIWDLKGGFGSLGSLQTGLENEIENESSIDNQNQHGNLTIIKEPRIPKSDYQQALDDFKPTPKLDPSNTKYWSDYTRLLYNHNSLNTLSDWEFDPSKSKVGVRRMGGEMATKIEFKDYSIGIEQWHDSRDHGNYLEDFFRPILEQCDALNGLNVVTDVDSAWGSFTSEMLGEIIDDYLPKNTIFTWGIYNDFSNQDLNRKERLSRVRTTAALLNNSSIFIPFSNPTNKKLIENLGSTQDELNSSWYMSSILSLHYETYSSLFSLYKADGISMSRLESMLTSGSKRNIVGNVESRITSDIEIDNPYSLSNDIKLDMSGSIFRKIKYRKRKHVFSKTIAFKDPVNLDNNGGEILKSDLRFEKILLDQKEKFADFHNLLENGTEVENMKMIDVPLKFNPPDTFPTSIKDKITNQLQGHSLMVSNKPNEMLLSMMECVSRFMKGDDREELIDELEQAAEQYHWENDFDWDSD